MRPLTALLLVALFPVSAAHAKEGARPAALAARWVEEGFHTEWRFTLRPDGRAIKERHRQCLETERHEKCAPLKYEGTWEADGKWLTLHLPGGMTERFGYALKGQILTLVDGKKRRSSFVYRLLDADGQGRPRALVGTWSEKDRSLTLRADGTYAERDEDGESVGKWRADERLLTLEPERGGEDQTFRYRTSKGAIVLQDTSGRSRSLRSSR